MYTNLFLFPNRSYQCDFRVYVDTEKFFLNINKKIQGPRCLNCTHFLQTNSIYQASMNIYCDFLSLLLDLKFIFRTCHILVRN
jgi:hypothetical protein